jgi:hypothetical protein
MLSSRMPELLAAEKRVGLHYKRGEKCFIDAATLTLQSAPVLPRISADLRKLG